MADLYFLATRPGLVARALSRAAAIGRAAVGPSRWAILSMAVGLLLGVAVCLLPPTGALGIVALAGVALLWALPELPAIPAKLVRRSFLAMLIVDLCVPAYYTISVAGLPWISARRLVTSTLIVFFALALAGSASVRASVARALGANPMITTCAFGFLGMAFLSIFTSIDPGSSLSILVEALVAWYLPFVAVLYVTRTSADVLALVRTFCRCAMFVMLGGAVSFVLQKNAFIAAMPHWLVNALLTNSPSFARLIAEEDFRLGQYRSASIYSVSLSFGEFEAMMVPLGIFFFLNGVGLREKLFGMAVVLSCFAAFFVSGARGGYMSAAVGAVVFSATWIFRSIRFGRGRSLAPSILVLVALLGFSVLAGLIATVPSLHNRVLGGGAGEQSNEARIEQWRLGIPKIESNPVTGHGFGLGGAIVGYHATTRETIDSYVLSALVETGVPGFVFFFALIGVAVAKGIGMALTMETTEGALSGALAASLAAFGFYRIGLSQVENNTTLFIMIGLLICLGSPSKNPAPAPAPS